ncbi:MAG: TonB-dependent receptor [Cytophagaceae bacterium]|nr:TonB-dependent receptor [Cytophagaceae bacterium]
MKYIYLLLTVTIFSISASLQGQTGTVSGYVKTADSVALYMASIQVKGTTLGANTHADGSFIVKNIPVGNQVLIIRYVGLASIEYPILVRVNETILINIYFQQSSSEMPKVVIEDKVSTYINPPSPETTRLPLTNLENPQSIQVINQEIIQDRQIQSVGEATKSMVGINAFSSSQYSDYVMRGFRTSPGNFAYNGMRGDFYQFDQATLTYNIERIEAIKGPASVLFSAGNPGGVINHITKKAQAAKRYELNYTFGSFQQHRILADATSAITNNKKLLYRLVVGYENTGQLDENLKIKNIFLAPQLQYNFSNRTSINYEFNYSNDNRTMGFNRGIPALFLPTTNTWMLDRFPNYRSLVDPNGTSIRNTQSHQFTFKHNFNDQIQLVTLYRAVGSSTFQADLSPGAWGIGATNDSIPLENRYWNEKLYNHQVSSYLLVALGKDKFIKNNLVFGIDANIGGRTAEYAGFQERIVSVWNPSFGWGFYDKNSIQQNMSTASYQSGWNERTILLASYIQDQISIGEKIKVLLGGRLESHNFKTDYFDLVSKQETSRDSLSATQFLPRVGLVYQPIKDIAFYYSYSEGFQPQWASNIAGGGPFTPERSRQHEVGVKKEWLENRLLTTIALYHIQKYDVLAPDPTDTNGLRLVQISNVYSKGIELSVQGKVSKELNVIANYSYNEARTPGDSGYDGFPAGWFPNAPNHNGNIWMKYTFSKGIFKNVGIGSGINYVGKRTTYTPGFEIPSFTTIDAAISYNYNKFNFGFNIYNIGNTTYWNGAYGPSNLWPGNPTSFRFSVGYIFK